MQPIGIPYARHERDPLNGRWVAVCPTCGERITLKHRKDFESFSGREYAAHHAQRHLTDDKGTQP